MNAALKEVMRDTLSTLADDCFDQFKHRLRDHGQVKWGKLHKATRDETVDLMVEAYSSSKCGGIMAAMLEKIDQKELATKLKEDLANLGGQSSNPLQSGGGGGVNVNVSAHSGGMVNAPSMSGCTVNGPLNFYGGVPNAQQGGDEGQKGREKNQEEKNKGKGVPGPGQDQGQTNLNFFNKHKATLEKRMPILSNVLNQLEAGNVLDAEERETVEAEQISVKRNRALIVMLDRKGEKAQEKFYQILKKTDPHLVEDLES
ncbi:uncharacterized protein LOC134085142 [Sardina pilchardus]|uniref:uncharacterized protein LOC134085142 n=1 Tax=Sardina pilchardus TaxID=27697 RepID=UPI002E0E0DF9